MANKNRYIFIDLFRGWAVLVMVEVHVVNAFLLQGYRETDWFSVLNFFNGLVAPSFLFISGFAFVLVGQRKWDEYLLHGPVLRKQILRIMQVWMVGYLLHIPYFSLSRMLSTPMSEWKGFWTVDVLHCIAFSLMFLLVSVLVLKTHKRHFIGTVSIALLIVLFSPYLYTKEFDGIFPRFLGNYFTAAYRSQFPLFPWMGFVLFGGAFAQLFVWWKRSMHDTVIVKRFLIIGGACIAVSLILTQVPYSFYDTHNYWRSSPLFFFLRLGIVVILMTGFWIWEQKKMSTTSAISIVGSESLLAYSFHLLAIYGMFYQQQSLARIIGQTLSIPEVVGLTILLIMITAAISYVWHTIKQWSRLSAQVLEFSFIVIALYFFITTG